MLSVGNPARVGLASLPHPSRRWHRFGSELNTALIVHEAGGFRHCRGFPHVHARPPCGRSEAIAPWTSWFLVTARVLALFEVVNRYVDNLPPMPYPAPMIRNTEAGSEMALMHEGMPPPPRTGGPPVANIRNTSQPQERLAQASEPLLQLGGLQTKSRAERNRRDPSRIRQGRRLLLFDNGRAAATNSAFLADFGLLDAVFSFHAGLEGHRTDLRHDFLVRRTCGGNRALMARTLYDVVLIC